MINSKILGSMMVMGIAIVLAGAGTMAYFSDTETSSGNNFTAGQLDLMIDFEGYYNKEVDGEPNAGMWELKDLDGDVFFDFDDIKPGDWGEGTISVHVYDNPAHLWISIENLVDNENGMNEPEMEVDDTENIGELSQSIWVEIWVDDGNNIMDGDESIMEEGWLSELSEGWYLGVIENCENYYYGVSWSVPSNVGNEIQSDSVTFDIVFYAEQARHNPGPMVDNVE